MVSKIYPKGKEAVLGTTDLSADNIKACIVSSAYTQSDAHQFLSDLAGVIGTSANLSGKTIVNGSFVGSVAAFAATATSTAIAFILYKDTGVASTSNLLFYFDGIQFVTIATTVTSASVVIDPSSQAIANSAVLTRVSGTGAATITLSGAGGASLGGRTLTASSSVSQVAGDVYSVTIPSTGFPLNTNNGQNVTLTLASPIFTI